MAAAPAPDRPKDTGGGGSTGVSVTAADREELVIDTLILQEKLCELSQQLEVLRKTNSGVASDVALLREAKKRLASLPAASSAGLGR